MLPGLRVPPSTVRARCRQQPSRSEGFPVALSARCRGCLQLGLSGLLGRFHKLRSSRQKAARCMVRQGCAFRGQHLIGVLLMVHMQ